jgi:glycosyltransferase involved in cell wall biosynthesis
MEPTFTVLLAVTRSPDFLPYAIESVLLQTIRSFELLVVCDGAPPATIECAQEYAQRDSRIQVRVFPKGERMGEAHWHTAISAAAGRYVAHLEDDDLWFPSHLEELDKLLQDVDFGNNLHVWAKPGDIIEMLASNLADSDFRQRMLNEKFNRIGFSVCGYRIDAYRRLVQGWAPGPKGLWPDLNMWRKFLRQDGLTFGTRMAVTALVLATLFRRHMSLEEQVQETRKWHERIRDDNERARIVDAAWRSVVDKHLQLEIKKLQAEIELSKHVEREGKSILRRIAKPFRKVAASIEKRTRALR